MFGRILSVALLLSTVTASSQAFALSDCPVDVECGTSPITMLAALPLSGLSVLAGTFVVPALVKSDTEEGPGYLSLMVTNLLISTTVGLTVLADPMEVFGSGDDNRYLAANAILPVAASMGTSLILRAFFSGPDPITQSAESSSYVPAVGMMVGEHHKGLILGWAF